MNQIKVNYLNEILLLLLKKECHGRELAKELKTSLTRIQAALTELKNCNVLDYKKEGKNHVYFIKQNLVARAFVLSAENYKFTKLLRKYNLLEYTLKEITEKFPDEMIILFGSYAKFIADEDSDIDVYVDTSDKKAKDTLRRVNESLSIQIGEFDKESLLIKEIIKNHVIIQGGEKFYEKLGFFK